MTLKELSVQYRASAQSIRERLRELHGLLAQSSDPDEVWHLKRRIAELVPILTQANDLVWLLEHYYEGGGAERDDRYGFNGIRRIRKAKAPKRNSRTYPAERTNGASAPNLPDVPLSGHEYAADCCHPRRRQKRRKPRIEACRATDSSHHEIPLDFNDAMLDSFFGPLQINKENSYEQY